MASSGIEALKGSWDHVCIENLVFYYINMAFVFLCMNRLMRKIMMKF